MKTLSLVQMQAQGVTESMIAEYANEVKLWRRQNIMVEQTKDHEDETQRWTPYPAPVANPMIMEAVDEKGEIAYTIEDDTQALLDEQFDKKRQALFQLINDKEKSELAKIIPPGKGRLIQMHEQRILSEDNMNIEKTDYKRPEEDQNFMDELTKIKADIMAVQWWAAEQLSEIADLTEENIDAWKPADLKI